MILLTPIFRLIFRIFSFLLYLLTILAAYGGTIDPAVLALSSALVLGLPYLAIMTAVVTVAWFCMKKLIMGLLGVAVLVISWGGIAMVFPVSFPASPTKGADTFTIASFNCFHMDDIREARAENRSLRWMLDCDADIICLQESLTLFEKPECPWLDPVLIDSLLAKYPYHNVPGYSDLKVLSRYPLTASPTADSSNNPHWPPAYRFYRASIKGRSVDIANVHLPSYRLSEDERQVVTDIKGVESARKSASTLTHGIMSKLKTSFRERAETTDSLISALRKTEGPVIICGDFNDVPASWCYRQILKAGFQDTYTATSFGPMITYNDHLFYFHLDQIMYRGDLRPLRVSRSGMNASDHYPVIARFELP